MAISASVRMPDTQARSNAGDDSRGRQHDADLECGGRDFEVMVFCRRVVTFVLGMLGARGQLLGTFAGLRLER